MRETTPPAATKAACSTCSADLAFLRRRRRPSYSSSTNTVRIVDLFAGGGGLTLGAAEAARRVGRGVSVALAVENDSQAADIYERNFPGAHVIRTDIRKLFEGKATACPTAAEQRLVRQVGSVDLLLAGPPCQGHSDLNNHTRRKDPRNSLYLLVARAAEVLRPTFVLVENVPAVQHDTGKVVARATKRLEAAGYIVASRVLDLVRFGVPQRRRRHILLAVRGTMIEPDVVLDMRSPCAEHEERSVRWAIGDLDGVEEPSGFDAPSVPTPTNLERMRWLIDNDEDNLPNSMRPTCHQRDSHTYNAMYGRLSWNTPAPTITTGFGSMGQGRFVHPAHPRTITPHEAARLQTLPDFFDLDPSKGRGAWARIIGNAVPPLLGVHVVEPLLCAVAPVRGRASDTATTPRTRTRRSMAPPPSSELIHRRMATTKRRDTQPELALRSSLHALGLRFSVDRPIPGTRRRADVVFPTERVVVYVDGCFWHVCPQHSTIPKQNTEWWMEKLTANQRRDVDTDTTLRQHGWTVLRFWEHEEWLVAAQRVRDAVLQARRSRARNGEIRAEIGRATRR